MQRQADRDRQKSREEAERQAMLKRRGLSAGKPRRTPSEKAPEEQAEPAVPEALEAPADETAEKPVATYGASTNSGWLEFAASCLRAACITL